LSALAKQPKRPRGFAIFFDPSMAAAADGLPESNVDDQRAGTTAGVMDVRRFMLWKARASWIFFQKFGAPFRVDVFQPAALRGFRPRPFASDHKKIL